MGGMDEDVEGTLLMIRDGLNDFGERLSAAVEVWVKLREGKGDDNVDGGLELAVARAMDSGSVVSSGKKGRMEDRDADGEDSCWDRSTANVSGRDVERMAVAIGTGEGQSVREADELAVVGEGGAEGEADEANSADGSVEGTANAGSDGEADKEDAERKAVLCQSGAETEAGGDETKKKLGVVRRGFFVFTKYHLELAKRRNEPFKIVEKARWMSRTWTDMSTSDRKPFLEIAELPESVQAIQIVEKVEKALTQSNLTNGMGGDEVLDKTARKARDAEVIKVVRAPRSSMYRPGNQSVTDDAEGGRLTGTAEKHRVEKSGKAAGVKHTSVPAVASLGRVSPESETTTTPPPSEPVKLSIVPEKMAAKPASATIRAIAYDCDLPRKHRKKPKKRKESKRNKEHASKREKKREKKEHEFKREKKRKRK